MLHLHFSILSSGMRTAMVLYYLFPSMIFKKGDIKIGTIATSPPQGRAVKMVNVYPLFLTPAATALVPSQHRGKVLCGGFAHRRV